MSTKIIDRTKALELRREGKKYSEIAEILSCSVSWVKQNLVGTPKKRFCRCCKQEILQKE